MAGPAEDVQLVDGDELERGAVKEEGLQGRKVPSRPGDVQMLQENRNKGVEEHPAVQRTLVHVRHLVRLLVDRNVLVEMRGMDPQEFIEPVVDGPSLATLAGTEPKLLLPGC